MFLNVDVLSNLSVDQVMANPKVGKTYYDPGDGEPVSGNKSLARDTAFQLLDLILHPQYVDDTKDKAKLVNAVLFMVSHPGTFKSRTQRIIRIAYEEEFVLSKDQH
jgi:hypothetical protein